jgi:ABC-type multidrug transport system ATPase subunit
MLKIQKLNKTYQKHLVLKNVEIELNNNNVVALLGPNGSGKTTLIKTLLINKNKRKNNNVKNKYGKVETK